MQKAVYLALFGIMLVTPAYACEWATSDPWGAVNCPKPIKLLGERVMGCVHFGGEEGFDEERAKFIAKAIEEDKCDAVEEDAQKLRKNYQSRSAELLTIEKMMEEWDAAFHPERIYTPYRPSLPLDKKFEF